MTVQNSASTDVLSLSFIDPLFPGDIAGSILIDNDAFNNYTTVAFEKDFFTPSNGLTFTIADNDLSQITSFLQRGYQVQVKINGNFQMIGYIFDYHTQIDRHAGTELTIKCKDLLEYMGQASVPPNMGTGSSAAYHFDGSQTLQEAMTTLAASFSAITGQPKITVEVDSSISGDFASGFNRGAPVKISKIYGNTLASVRSKSISSSLQHLAQPNKGGETFLAYMLRLVKHVGCNLKMSDYQPNVIFCKPPVYDRENASPFFINHYTSAANASQNNAHSAEYYFNGDRQPSVVIMESNSNNMASQYQATVKGVSINELTGYPSPAQAVSASASIPGFPTLGTGLKVVQGIPDPYPSISNPQGTGSIDQACAGKEGTGWFLAPFNRPLWLSRNNFPVDTFTQISLPHYGVDPNAHVSGLTGDTSYAASKYMAECQDRYVEMVYHVDGWTCSSALGTKYVWQPDTMIKITEEAFSPGVPKTFNMWIKRVRFTKNRHGGTETEVVCTLPYTHAFELTS